LLRDGELLAGLDDDRLEPRTAAGVSADGTTLFLLVVDGRQRDSRGASLRELGEAMRDFDASDALNLDGGGSSTVVAREPGEVGVRVRNDPSDGSERPVSNRLGLTTADGSGTLDGFCVTPSLDGENTHRVFPGLSRRFKASGHDETYAPVDATPRRWRAVPAKLGRFDDDGRFTAWKSGSGEAVACRRGTKGTTRLRVLDELRQVETDAERPGLAPGDSATFAVLGFDARGYAAPVEPRDVSLDYDDSLVTVEPTDEGTFRVAPTGESGSTIVTVSVLSEEAYVPVAVGLATKRVSGFEDSSAWWFMRYPSEVEGSMSFVEGRSGTGLPSTTTSPRRLPRGRCTPERSRRSTSPANPSESGCGSRATGRARGCGASSPTRLGSHIASISPTASIEQAGSVSKRPSPRASSIPSSSRTSTRSRRRPTSSTRGVWYSTT
jgi:hypothetical protein